MHREITVRTNSRSDFVDITGKVQQALDDIGFSDGICHVHVTHTTAGITINENADPAVTADLSTILDRLVPWTGGYKHREGNSAAHAKASLTGFSVSLPLRDGKLVLGTWQCIYFCEFDGPRTRNVIVSALGG